VEEPLDISSEQLARYVAGETDAGERSLVERWAASADANQRELDAMLAIWSMSGDPAPEVDVDAAWSKVRSRIEEGATRGRVIPLWQRPAFRWAAAAAVVIGFFGITRILAPHEQELVAFAEPVTSRLEDSSEVVLAPGSTIEARMGHERSIALQGKAWFEVARDAEHPFVVRSGDLEVTVLGTGFEVTAYDTSNVWSVRVRHGRVRAEAGEERVELTAGERVRFDRKARVFVRNGPVTVEAWGERIVQFQNAPMSEVVAELQRIYHVRVGLSSKALARCRLTATFEGEPIDQVLRVIAGTFGMRVTKPAPDNYLLEGDGC
jgi:transmembrane sensor